MSIASPFESDSSILGRRIGESLALLRPAVETAGFWSAVVLPFVLTGLLVSGAVGDHPTIVVALLVVNVLGLAVGREHNT